MAACLRLNETPLPWLLEAPAVIRLDSYPAIIKSDSLLALPTLLSSALERAWSCPLVKRARRERLRSQRPGLGQSERLQALASSAAIERRPQAIWQIRILSANTLRTIVRRRKKLLLLLKGLLVRVFGTSW